MFSPTNVDQDQLFTPDRDAISRWYRRLLIFYVCVGTLIVFSVTVQASNPIKATAGMTPIGTHPIPVAIRHER
jgi:hypothetical protein